MTTYDLIIKNGTVVDFDAESGYINTDIGIRDGKIAALAHIDPNDANTTRTIDAAGQIVSPGFIDFHSNVNCNTEAAERLLLQGATTTIGGERNFNGRRINEILEHGFLINQGFLLSHSFTLRGAVGLNNPYEPASKEDIRKMLDLAALFFEFGCFGVYFGLEMVPGTGKDELIQLTELAKRYGRKSLIHIRKDGVESIEAVKEAIEVARMTRTPIHILHLMYMAGEPELMTKCLELISAAIDDGLDITADTGLYEAFPAYIGSSILAGDWKEHYNKTITYRDILISSGIHNGEFCSPKAFEFLREEFPYTSVSVFAFDEKACEIALKKPYIFVSTNACDGHIYRGTGHPETAGTFPKLIRKYVRQNKTISLLDALYKITCGPAKRFGIKNKGALREGYDADIVIFDAEEVQDMARFSNVGHPDAPPRGINHVIVNGKIVVSDGAITDETNAGRLLTAE